MTFEDRLAELGVDLSDLPQSDGCRLAYDRQSRSMAEQEAYRFVGMSGQLVDIINCLKIHQEYILHLTDVIDRMETRLVNVTVERDWLQTKCCALCVRAYEDGPGACDNCDIGDGVPEDWRPDDAVC